MKQETKDQHRMPTQQIINTGVNGGEKEKKRKKHLLMTAAYFDILKQMKET